MSVPWLNFGDISLKRKLGAGTYGSVFTINGEELSKKLEVGECFGDCWVVKRTEDKNHNDITISEIANIVSMNHINIINLFAAGVESSGLYFFVMPAAISDLSKIIKQGILDEFDKDAFTFQLMAGVNYYIKQGFIHADLKPQNLLIYQEDERKILKIADWGIASPTVCSESADNFNIVTLWYRAPELLWEIPYKYEIDLWSVGCIVYEIYTESVLFPGDSMVGQAMLIMQQLGDPKKDPKLESYRNSKHFQEVPNWDPNPNRFLSPKIPDHVSEIIRSLLVYDPNDRPNLGAILGYYADDPSSNFSSEILEYPESFTEEDRMPNACSSIYQKQDFAINLSLPYENLSDSQIITQIEFLEYMRSRYSQPDKVFYAACYYFYKYVSLRKGTSSPDLLAATCFYLASIYYNYKESVTITNMIIQLDGFTTTNLTQMIQRVLFTINFDLYVTTPDDYISIDIDRDTMKAKKYTRLGKLYMTPRIFDSKSMKEIYEAIKRNSVENFSEIDSKYSKLNNIRKEYNV